MPDEKTPPAQQPKQFGFEIVEPDEGVFRTYGQVSHLSWGGMDLTIDLYQVVQPNREFDPDKEAPSELLHTASVTMAWAAAKLFSVQLGQILERYEKVYGPINTEFKQI